MSYTAEEKIKLAGEDSKDRLYEAKQNQKAIRILTVAAYVLCVSLVAIMLSLYYIFFWDPSTNPMQQKTQTIDTLIIPDHLAIRLANRSEVPASRFFHTFYQHLVQDRVVKIRKEVQISESTNLTKLIELYHQQQQQQQQHRPGKQSPPDGPLSYQVQAEQQPGGRASDGPRLHTDEDDGSDDYEQSGNYELYSNHTTIQLDADETGPQ
ncbi:AGAP000104-PA [Anopheles gambiae str. PEST]|uniref:AGAP000104-PA n=1 Tax=Anopheles gambiae TaxID=7165 RepID=Q7QEQ7_ANOGA|nr:AGAP000104-PA [Anopheles gambiae str. PEST]